MAVILRNKKEKPAVD